jgi:lipopolysaccharide export LptBFGC system permease protein LptF
MTLPVVHVPYVENPMKSSGNSSTEFVIAVVALGLFVAMFVFGVQLWQFIE